MLLSSDDQVATNRVAKLSGRCRGTGGAADGEDHGQSEAQHMTLEIDRFAWLYASCQTPSQVPLQRAYFPVFGRVPCWVHAAVERGTSDSSLSRGCRATFLTARIFQPPTLVGQDAPLTHAKPSLPSP